MNTKKMNKAQYDSLKAATEGCAARYSDEVKACERKQFNEEHPRFICTAGLTPDGLFWSIWDRFNDCKVTTGFEHKVVRPYCDELNKSWGSQQSPTFNAHIKSMTVRDVPEHFMLVSDSQDVAAVLEHFGVKAGCWGCLFVEVIEGDYGTVFACERSVPCLDAPMYALDTRNQFQRVIKI